jgi:hypothetical protein
LLGPVPEFPAQMEQSINAYLKRDSVECASSAESGQNGKIVVGTSNLGLREKDGYAASRQ